MGKIPQELLEKVCARFDVLGGLPYTVQKKHSKIVITRELIKATLEILNDADNKMLPQRALHENIENTKEGLDKEIKKKLHTNFSFAKYVSDVLGKVGVVRVIKRVNSPNRLTSTQLLDEWTW
ncbi:hypothetical protein FACS189494_07680 [Spirochaetia bacterium]|nr:hypothetical protein FACS189494_07680 [Spirochaetia bacterium]